MDPCNLIAPARQNSPGGPPREPPGVNPAARHPVARHPSLRGILVSNRNQFLLSFRVFLSS